MTIPNRSPRCHAGAAGMTTAAARAAELLGWLERRGTRKHRDGLARYGIVTAKAHGVPVGDLQRKAKSLGRDHALALALWDTGWYEARMLAAFVDEPDRVTAAQMDRWAREFDNWGICDTVIMHLFDRTPHAWRKVDQWSGRRGEFIKRAGFAMLASLALHDKVTGDGRFLRALPLIEAAATDERNFVTKGVNWALRSIGHRSVALHAAAIAVAGKLARSEAPTPRWIGQDALRDLHRPLVRKRVAAKDQARARRVAR